MGKTCSMIGARRNACNFLICKDGANSQVGKLWLRLEDMYRADVKEMGQEKMDWINLAQDMKQ